MPILTKETPGKHTVLKFSLESNWKPVKLDPDALNFLPSCLFIIYFLIYIKCLWLQLYVNPICLVAG